MTAPQKDGADRVSGVAKFPLTASTALSGLAILLLVGLLLRLTIAYVLLPGSGFESDIGTFTAWARMLADTGPGTFYSTTEFADYPPGYLYVLWLIGELGNVLAPFAGGSAAAATGALIKLPAILADIAVGFVLYHVVRTWRAPHLDAHKLGLTAAALYLFNPVTWYDSAVWGQTDAFGALVIVLTVAALVRGNSEGASVLAVVAALIKPQFGIVLLPLVGIVLLRRHLLRPGSAPRNPVIAPAAVRRWLDSEQGPLRLVSSGVISFVVLLALLAPFSLDIFGFVNQMQKTAAGYPYLSINAYNPWALIGSDGADGIAFGGAWSWNPDTVPLLGPIPGVIMGTALLAAGFMVGVARGGWRDDRRSIVLVAIFLALAFFMLPTRVHERYMFPIFGLLPLLAVVDRRWLWATLALSVAAFINLHGVLTTPLYASPNVETLPFGEDFRSTFGVLTSIAIHVAGFAFIAWQMRPSAVDEPDPYALPAIGARRTVPRERGVSQPDVADHRPGVGELLASLVADLRLGLARLFSSPSIRRDRSALLATETGGRFDRRDLVFVVLVFLSTLFVRTYRLEVPYSMHFDEVYHARTAVEFLQDWQYDMPHSIYEYTHPHMAKYLMAVGIMALGNNRVVDVDELGTSVRAAAIEQRWSPPDDVNRRYGDRLYVVTPSDVRVYDAATRSLVATVPAIVETVAVDDSGRALFLGDASGVISRLDTRQLDELRETNTVGAQLVAQRFTELSGIAGTLASLTVTAERLVAVASDGTVASFDPATGVETGRATLPSPSVAVGVPARATVVVDPAQVTEPGELARSLGAIIGRDSVALESTIAAATTPIPVAGLLSKATIDELRTEMSAGNLIGVTIEDGRSIAVGTSTGVVLLDAQTLAEFASFAAAAPVTGLALVEQGPEQPTIYAASGDRLMTIIVSTDDGTRTSQPVTMPNAVSGVYWNRATTMVHALGLSQDGAAPTVYVVEPRSNSVFADARLAAEPRAVLLDVQRERPAEDRNDLLAIDGNGRLETVDTGNNQFAYRFPGVLLGSLMAVCIYLLARFLFRRRSVALIASLVVLVDGMFFANARIAMNDAYVAFFIVAAFTLFVPLWLGRWRRAWQIATGLAGVGILLGLALASKWVGAYAIGALGLLILLRSALGRMIALVAMIGLTALLGYIAITPHPDVESPQLNYPFVALMLGLTALLAVAIAVRPVRMTREELRLAVLVPLAAGVGLAGFGAFRLLFGPPVTIGTVLTPTRALMFGLGLVVIAAAVLALAWFLGTRGYGPLARPGTVDPKREPASPPPPRGWLRPGSGLLGLPWLLGLGAITVIPLLVYLASYVPWIELGNRWDLPFFPPGEGGQAFLDLQKSMYDYHNYLRATHAASSPWWAWPFDLKPVWFEQSEYAGSTTAVIYDTGNLVLFWLSIPAVLWVAWQAWRRRSLALTFIVIAICSLWLPWARIDRATFQYHIFTTLPFSFLALAYFLAELWHGPSRRTWALARGAAALAVIGAPLLWLLRVPLCSVARTEQVNAGTEVCASLSRELVLTDVQMVGILLAVGGLISAGAVFFGLFRADEPSRARTLLLPVCFAIALLGVVIVVVGAGIDGQPVLTTQVQAEWPALGALLLLLLPAYFVLRATDPRRFVAAALAAAVIWFVAFYPNIASLPVPRPLSQIHLGLLPTWNWGFQFGVNMDEPNRTPPEMSAVALLAIAVVVLCVAAIYAARAWRAERVEEPQISALPEAG